MRIAMIDPGGYTVPYDHHLCDALDRRGDTVRFMTDNLPENWRGDYEVDTHFYRIERSVPDGVSKGVRTLLKGLEHPLDHGSLLAKLTRFRPDVIHFQWFPLPIVDGPVVRLYRRIAPVVLTAHDSVPFRGAPNSRLQMYGARAALRSPDRLIVHTESTRTAMVESGIESERLCSIPHGVLEYPSSVDASAEKSDELRVLFFGTIKPYKGVDVLIDAVAELPSSLRQRLRVHIAGEPRVPVDPLKRRATETDVADCLEWDLGRIPHEEVGPLFEAADVVALPYRHIDQSGVLMTALPFGVPVVATDVGGISEVLTDGVHGRLVSPGDPVRFGAALEDLLSLGEERRESMGEAVRELAETTHSWGEIARKHVSCYRSSIAER